MQAKHPPLVLLTTNGTREMTDALRRRCLHAFLDYPPPSRELAILELRVPGIAKALAAQLAAFVQKRPRASTSARRPRSRRRSTGRARCSLLGASALDPELVAVHARALLKHEGDKLDVEPRLDKLLAAAEQAAPAVATSGPNGGDDR